MLLGSNSNLVLWTHAGLCYGIYIYIYIYLDFIIQVIPYHIYIYIHMNSWTIPYISIWYDPSHFCHFPILRTQKEANMSYWSVALASVWGTKPLALLAQCFSTSRPVFLWSGKKHVFIWETTFIQMFSKDKKEKHRKPHLIYVKRGKQT